MSAADGFAIAMLGILVLTLGTIGFMLFFMLRSSQRRDKDELAVEKLLEEVSEIVDREERPNRPRKPKARPGAPSAEDIKPGEAWEKAPDWWKE